MKSVLISDTHMQHDDFLDMPEGDILIHAGDMTWQGTVQEIIKVNAWFGKYKHKYKKIIVTPGNHDWLFQRDPNHAKMLMSNATVLIDERIEFEGLKIWGSPRTPIFCNWAFNEGRGEEIKRYWDMIPDDTNVLITHGPAYSILDEVRPGTVHRDKVGCYDLLEALKRLNQLKLHVFGHIHQSRGIINTSVNIQGPLFKSVNASNMVESYNLCPPMVIAI